MRALAAAVLAATIMVAHPWVVSVLTRKISILAAFKKGQNSLPWHEAKTRYQFTWDDGVTRQVTQHYLYLPSLRSPAVLRTQFWFTDSTIPPNRYEPFLERRAHWTPNELSFGKPFKNIVSLGYGWPFISLAADYQVLPRPSRCVRGIPLTFIPQILFYDSWDTYLTVALPTRPVWRGVLANTAIYWTACLGMIYFAPWARRRIFHHRRGWSKGICPVCAYSVEGLDTCPECGATRPCS